MCADDVVVVDPREDLREAYADYMADVRAGEPTDGAFTHGEVGSDFGAFVRKLEGEAKGVALPEGHVPQNTYWLVRGGRILGASHLRHRLTEALRDYGGHIGYAVRPCERRMGYGTRLLALTLDKAGELGLGRVLVTCDKDNIASARVIQQNGGRLDSESVSPQTSTVEQRYWIDLCRTTPWYSIWTRR